MSWNQLEPSSEAVQLGRPVVLGVDGKRSTDGTFMHVFPLKQGLILPRAICGITRFRVLMTRFMPQRLMVFQKGLPDIIRRTTMVSRLFPWRSAQVGFQSRSWHNAYKKSAQPNSFVDTTLLMVISGLTVDPANADTAHITMLLITSAERAADNGPRRMWLLREQILFAIIASYPAEYNILELNIPNFQKRTFTMDLLHFVTPGKHAIKR
ncbi:hypothetical protein DFS33DRAFT_1451004 [Desarmillaria ectypa]|nr:hypothetical protein DFS33DRAFT_1451004 [Desarmillaria ectypa]